MTYEDSIKPPPHETLSQKQQRFFFMFQILMAFIHDHGYHATFGDAFRDDRCVYGQPFSLHRKRLAVDINLIDQEGNWLQKTEDHLKCGEFWESMGGSWGGRFKDGNHYSLEHEGFR